MRKINIYILREFFKRKTRMTYYIYFNIRTIYTPPSSIFLTYIYVYLDFNHHCIMIHIMIFYFSPCMNFLNNLKPFNSDDLL